MKMRSEFQFPGGSGSTGELVRQVIATGSSQRRWLEDRFADGPNVEDWRGYGGDSSDQGTIQAALTQAQTRLNFIERTYVVEATLFIPSQLHVHANRAAFDCSAAADAITMFEARGTVSIDYAITTPPAVHASSVEVSALSAANFGADDWVEIISEDVFDPDRTITRIGEIKRVLSVSGTTITLQGTLACPMQYATSPKIRKISGGIVDFQWFGGVLIGRSTGTAPAQTGFKVSYGRNCHIHDVRSYRVMSHAFWFSHCVGSWLHNCSAQDSRNPGNGYGLIVGYSCTDCGAENLHAIRCRHAFTTGGLPSSDYGISYSCGVRGGYSAFSYGDSWDTHACSVDTFFDNCVAYDSQALGFNVECPSARVSNCASYRSLDNGFHFHNEATAMPASYILNGIYSEDSGDHGLEFAQALVAGNDPGVTAIQANDVTVIRPGDIGVYVLWNASSPAKATNIKISGYIEGGANSAAHIQYATDVDLSGLTLRTTQTGENALTLVNVERVKASVHTIMATGSTAIGLSLLGSTAVDISDASGYSPGGAGSKAWVFDNSCTNCIWGDTEQTFLTARWPGFDLVPTIGSGSGHRGLLFGSLTPHDELNVPAGGMGSPFNVTVTGCQPGDIILGISSDGTTPLTWIGTITAANTVSVHSFNPTGSDINPADGATVRVLVRKVT